MIFHASVRLDRFEKTFDSIARAGLSPEVRMTDVEHLMHITDPQVARLRALIEGRGLTTFTHGPFLGLDVASLNGHIAHYSVECLKRGCEVTAGLGASTMVVHTSYNPFYSRSGLREWLGNWSVRMASVLAKADGLGVRLAVENTWEERPEALMRLVDALPPGALAVCLDTGHVNAFSRYPFRRWWDALGDRVVALHLHDNDGLSDDHLPPGHGSFDFPSLAAVLRGLARPLLVTFEVELEGAIEGRARLEDLLSART